MKIDGNLMEELARELAREGNKVQAKFFDCFGENLFNACGNNRGYEGVESQLAWITGEMSRKALKTMVQFGAMAEIEIKERE